MANLEESQRQCQKLMANVDNGKTVAEKERLEKYVHQLKVSYCCVDGWLNEWMNFNFNLFCVYLIHRGYDPSDVGTCQYRNKVTNLLHNPLLGALVSGRSSTDNSTKHTHTNRWYTHTATYHVNTQRTQISGRHHGNGTKHGIWPPEDGRIKRTETCRGLFVFTNMFLTF